MINDVSKLKIGDKVCYQPAHYGGERWENGMVKEIPDHDSVRVVTVQGIGIALKTSHPL
jgi:hypothetical protein